MINKLIAYEQAIKFYINEFGTQGAIHSIHRKDHRTIVMAIEGEFPYQIVLQDTDNRDVVRIDDRLFIYHDGSGWEYLCRV